MVAQVAASTVAATDRGRPFYLDFREQHWVPGFTFLVDVAAVETALLFGYLVRYALNGTSSSGSYLTDLGNESRAVILVLYGEPIRKIKSFQVKICTR